MQTIFTGERRFGIEFFVDEKLFHEIIGKCVHRLKRPAIEKAVFDVPVSCTASGKALLDQARTNASA
jgi:hypothetical protein